MPTAFITRWDGYTNSVRQHYLPIQLESFKPPNLKEPITLEAYTAGIVRDVICKEEHIEPESWGVAYTFKMDDEHLFIVIRKKAQPTRVMTLSLRWHW